MAGPHGGSLVRRVDRALAGLTPRQAAVDPTRREGLEPLLASFDRMAADGPGTVTMRPERLRELLGLD
jgi:hypothetical protein